MYLVFVCRYTPNHTPLKCRCPNYGYVQFRHIYLPSSAIYDKACIFDGHQLKNNRCNNMVELQFVLKYDHSKFKNFQHHDCFWRSKLPFLMVEDYPTSHFFRWNSGVFMWGQSCMYRVHTIGILYKLANIYFQIEY